MSNIADGNSLSKAERRELQLARARSAPVRRRAEAKWGYAVPEFFDAKELHPHLAGQSDSLYYVLERVLWSTAKSKWWRDGRVYSHLSAKFLREVVSAKHQAEVMRSLRESALDCSPYLKGEYPRGYRLRDEWLSQKSRWVEATDRKLVERQKAQIEAAEARRPALLPIHEALRRAQHSLTLHPEVWPEFEKLEATTKLSQHIFLTRIAEQRQAFSVSQYGRVFNGVTSLKRELRKHLRLRGQPIAGWDVSCCQPALLALLMRGFDGEKLHHQWVPLSSLRSSPPCSRLRSSDFLEFSDLVCSGKFNLELLREVGHASGRFSVLDGVKRAFLSDVVAQKKKYDSPVRAAVARRWPSVFQFIQQYNALDHAALIRRLQTLEAQLVIHTVAPTLVDDLPILTVHDAIFSRASDADRVQGAFLQAFDRLGFSMSIKPIQ